MIPVVASAISVALQVPQTGILLTLAFDLMLAGLLVPFVLGHYWSRAARRRPLAAIASGVVGAAGPLRADPDDLRRREHVLYIPNDTFGARFDGWPTFIAPIVSLLAFVAVALVTSGRPEAPLPSRSTPVAATEG